MEPDDLLCSRNARPQKVRRKGMRSFLCSRSARPQKDLARRLQSKTPHALAWLSIEWIRDYEWTCSVDNYPRPPLGKRHEQVWKNRSLFQDLQPRSSSLPKQLPRSEKRMFLPDCSCLIATWASAEKITS
jgi:hypothetical protein